MLTNSRADWHARNPVGSEAIWVPHQPTGVCIHYIGGSGTFTPSNHDLCLQTMRHLQDYAINGGNGWHYSDIEYNIAVCPHGYVIEARGVHLQGAAQLDYNSTYSSVLALMCVNDQLTDTMKQGIKDAITMQQHYSPNATIISGHGLLPTNPTGTACPGKPLSDWIKAGLPLHPTPPPPPVFATTKPEGAIMFLVYDGYPHCFWIDNVGHMQHNYDTGKTENLSTKYGVHEVLDIHRGVDVITDGDHIHLTACNIDGVQIYWNFARGTSWGVGSNPPVKL